MQISTDDTGINLPPALNRVWWIGERKEKHAYRLCKLGAVDVYADVFEIMNREDGSSRRPVIIKSVSLATTSGGE